MNLLLSAALFAQAHPPLSLKTWTALSVIAAGFAVVAVVRLRHPAPPPSLPPEPASEPSEASDAPSPETLAIIAACIAVTLGDRARIVSIRPKGFSIEMLMPPWSLEGRRQIYSSHQFR
jgi:hypothetical protein